MTQGLLADRLGRLAESSTLALNARVKQMVASGQAIFNLTAGELDSDTPVYIQKAVAGTLALNKYTPVAGTPALREAIALHANSFYAPHVFAPAEVVVTGGAKPALSGAFLALLNPGDEVIVPTPAWVSYRHLIELAGGIVVPVPLTKHWDLDVEAIAASLTPRTKAIIVNSPQNPTGSVFSGPAMKALSKLLAGLPVVVIADDIYAKLVFTPSYRPISTYNFNPDRLVIINGFSKSQALTGWRIGYLLAPVAIAEAVTKLLSHSNGNAPVPGQQAALAALAAGDVPEMLGTLKERRDLVANTLKDIPEITFELPGGAFYFLLDLQAVTRDTLLWCEKLLADYHVALVPGEAFDAPGYARLSFAASNDTLEGGIAGIKKCVQNKEKQRA